MTVKIRAGEAMRQGVPVLDSVQESVSLTDEWSARAQVRTHWSSPVILHEWDSAGAPPNVEIDTAENRVILTATSDETAAWAAWPVATPVFDLWVVDPLGEPHKILTDTLSVEPSYTRD